MRACRGPGTTAALRGIPQPLQGFNHCTMGSIPVRSVFVTGTDTGVGKTLVSAGLARTASDLGADVGVMKPFAAGSRDDVELLIEAARCSDPSSLVNPQFYPLPASPYAAARELGTAPDTGTVLECFERLQKTHGVIIAEGIGGIMTPILSDYSVADLILDMGLGALVVVGNRIGAVNHSILTARACKDAGVPIIGAVINCVDPGGYKADMLCRDVSELAGMEVLGAVPALESAGPKEAALAVSTAIDVPGLLSLSLQT
ncbi:cobyrinic acid a,c-diamide synthase/dethiobiotin synthetase [Cenarchaeum symbiosum A]|uniref:ATP-dependent dethiobiotin synthetase BioD n=1 Tax=Cenarchaeum symbiosum (strain A) TaxID=414004 RepID=A0RW94_CENSY|nr:cobyrinic acid a,c-diamide synthase/dethiobiotin synthetase [Cenarchaeum symbiosum A]